MLVRERNPLELILAPSVCVFQWEGRIKDEDRIDLAKAEQEARLETTQVGPIAQAQVSHGKLDAFGGLFVLRKILRNQDRLSRSQVVTGRILESTFGAYKARTSFFVGREPSLTSSRTLTQCFVSDLIDRFQLSEELLTLAVSIDDVNLLNESNYNGNSLGLVQARAKRWALIAKSEKTAWRRFLEGRAIKSIDGSAPGSVSLPKFLLTSLGDLSRFHWTAPLDYNQFLMFPTPLDSFCANIVLWSYGTYHCITVCATASHIAFSEFQELQRIWRSKFESA